jgi:hypothetical protein
MIKLLIENNKLAEQSITDKNISPRRRRPRVRFADKNETDTLCQMTCAAPLFSTLTKDNCQELWFQPDEVTAFKQEARNLVLFGKVGVDELAGLERFNLERSKSKKAAIQYVLLANQQQKGVEFVRMVSRECSTWATDAALIQGFNDFCQVYDPLASLLGDAAGSEKNYNDCLFGEDYSLLCKKRKTVEGTTSMATCDGEGSRRVRQRTLLLPTNQMSTVF